MEKYFLSSFGDSLFI